MKSNFFVTNLLHSDQTSLFPTSTPNDTYDMTMPFLPTRKQPSSKFQATRSTAFFAAIIALFFVAAINVARAQFTFASDGASNSAYSDGWASGDNGGTGFNAWSLTTGGTAGFYTGNPSDKSISGMPNPSWGMYANTGGFADANRSFASAMQVGDTFSLLWGINFDTGAGNKGFSLYVGGTEVVNVNNGGTSAITINGANVGFGYGTTAMTWTFNYVNATTLAVSANDRDGAGTFSTNITVTGGVSNFKYYISGNNNGGNAEPFYNNLLLTNSGLYNVATAQTESRYLTGSGNLAKTGNGTLTISGTTNNFTGTVGITNGAIRATASSALGQASAITVQSGAALEYTSGINNARALTINGTGISSGGALRNVSGNNTSSGTITLGSAARINSDAGTLTLDVSTGNAITGTFGVTFAGNGNIVVNDNINVSSASITKDGVGTLTVAGSQNATGGISVSGGTLVYNSSNSGSGSVTVASGGKLGGSGTLGAVTIQGGGTIAPGNSPGNLSVSSLTLNGGGFYDWEVTDATGAAGTGWDVITVGASSGTITLNATSGSQFTINVLGSSPTNWASNASRTWDIIDGGSWSPSFDASAFTINTAGFTASGTLGTWGVENNSGNLRLVYTAPATIYDLTVGSGLLQTQSEATGGLPLFSGAAATVNKLGAGTLVMTNTENSYTGSTTVKEGILQVNTAVGTTGNTVLGNASSAVIVGDSGAAAAAGFNFGAAVQNDRALNIVAGTGAAGRTVTTTITSGTATQAGNVAMATNTTYSAASGGTLRISGAISGAGNATISDSGTVLFSGNNTFTGTTTVSAGSTLIASNNNALGGGSAASTVSSGGVLAFAGAITSAENISISGTGLSAGGALRNVNGANTNSGTITVAANATISADSSTTLQLNNIDNGAVGRQLTFSNIGTIVVAGNFSNMNTTSTFFKNGSGSLVISNTSANTSGAQLQVGQGSVTLASGTYSTNAGTGTRGLDLGLTAGNVGSTFDTAFYANNGVTMSNSIYVAGGTGARILGTESTTGTATFNNEIYLDSTARLTAASGGTARFAGNFVNTGGLTKVGNGIVILAGTNANTGAVTISNGTLAVTNGAAINNSVLLTIDSGATLSVQGSETIGQFTGSGSVNVAIGQQLRSRYDSASNSFAGTITGSGEFLKGGTGTLTLSGANDYTGLTTHEAGVLLIGNNSALGTGVYQVDFNNATNKTIAANGSASFTLSQSNNIYNDLTLGEATGNTGKLTFSGGTALGNEVGQTRTLTVAANNNHEFSGAVTGNRGIIKAGTGTLTLSGNNTFGNTFQLNEGTVLVGNNSAFGAGFVQAQFGIASTKTIASASTAGYTITNNVNVFNDLNLGLASGGTGVLNFSGTFYLGDEVGQNRVITTAAGTGHAVSGAVTGNRGIVKQGAGTITLSGANTSSGGFFIDNGDLNLNGGSIAFSTIEIGGGVDGGAQPGNNASLRVTSGTFSTPITVNGNTNSSGVTGTRTIEFANASGSSTLSGGIAAEKTFTASVAESAATGVLSGAISGTGGLTKTGDGTITLSGASANTYSGLTTVSAGTLNLNKASGNAIAGATTISSGAVLLLSGSNQVDSGVGDLVTLSGGTIRRGGNVSEVFGNLSVTTASFLDYGAANSTGTLSFGTYAPSALLTVQNFLPGNVLTFGSDLTSLINNASLFSLGAQGFTSSWSSGTSTFTITAIPEPSTYVAAAGLLAMFLWPVRRRLIKDAKSILGLRAPARERFGS